MDTKNLKVGDKITILFGNDMKDGVVKERKELEKGLVEYEIQLDDQVIRRTNNRIVLYPKK